MKIGLLGYPLTGKSTLFQILTGAGDEDHPHARAQLRAGVTRLPDPRLDEIAGLFQPKKITPATIEFLDPPEPHAADRHDALPPQEIRAADAFIHMIRAFEDPAVPATDGGVDPKRDVIGMETDLLLADLAVVEKRLQKLKQSLSKHRDPDDLAEQETLQRVRAGLEKEQPVRSLALRPEERKKLRGFAFLSDKPILGVLNVGENEVAESEAAPARLGLDPDQHNLHAGFCAVSAKIEAEVAQLDEADAAAFRADLGIPDLCRDRIVRLAWAVLEQATFFTYVEGEVRAWNVAANTAAQRAAGRIHSDMERGFIRAEVISFADLMEAKTLAEARHRGTLRTEGKDYPVVDGDIITFRFNV
jgi:GTP-binding protein YchF